MVQAALAKAVTRWRHIHGRPLAYVQTIMHRDHISAWRPFRGYRVTSTAEPPERPGPAADTHLKLVLREALLSLPPRQRAVLVLRFMKDRPANLRKLMPERLEMLSWTN